MDSRFQDLDLFPISKESKFKFSYLLLKLQKIGDIIKIIKNGDIVMLSTISKCSQQKKRSWRNLMVQVIHVSEGCFCLR